MAFPKSSTNKRKFLNKKILGKTVLLFRTLGVLAVAVYFGWIIRAHKQLRNSDTLVESVSKSNQQKNPLGGPDVSVAVGGSINPNEKYPIVSLYDKGISACLLVMDDNHFLIEWLAFHYHTLPLRYLVIAVDPRSKTSPVPILQRWKDMNLTIVLWQDDDFMSNDEKKEAEQYVAEYFGRQIGDNLIRHRARQRLFYYKCMMHLKEQQRDWSMLIDSDEFLFVNYPTVLQRLHRNKALVPPITQQGSVLEFLRHELQHPQHNLTTPCVQIPRIRFGATESTPEQVPKNVVVPAAFSSSTNNFATLRWRKHAHPDDYGNNRISKVLIDLSRVPWEELKPVDSIHRPIRSMCGQRRLHIRKNKQVLVINHYLGTLEQYQFRDDSRQGNERSLEQYQKASRVQSATDDEIRPWLQGFVDENGVGLAQKLLKDVGSVGISSSSG